MKNKSIAIFEKLLGTKCYAIEEKQKYSYFWKYNYDLSEEKMNKIDKKILKIPSKYYAKLSIILEKEFEKYQWMWEEMTFEEYKKQILIYYVFSEIKIKELQNNYLKITNK